MFRKRWILIAVACLLAGALALAMNTTWIAEAFVKDLLSRQEGVVLRRVTIAHQAFTLPGRLDLSDVTVMAEVGARPLLLQVPRAAVTGLQSLMSADRRVLLGVEDARLTYDLAAMSAVKAEFTLVPDGVSGPVSAATVRWDKIHANDLSLFLIVNASGVECRALTLQAYDGRVTGKVNIHARPSEKAGTYEGEFFLEGVDVARMSDVNAAVADQVNGLITGSVVVTGSPTALLGLDTDLAMLEGGRISASLLGALTQYLPQSREKKRLDTLIRRGGKLGMEALAMTMKGGQDGKYSGEVKLRSREINLELNLTHEINTDGSLASLWAYWQKFLQ